MAFAKEAAVASRQDTLAFKKATHTLKALLGLIPRHGEKYDLATRKRIVSSLPDGRSRRREYEFLECLVTLVPGILALCPQTESSQPTATTTNRSEADDARPTEAPNPWLIFASVNPLLRGPNKGPLPKDGPRVDVRFEPVVASQTFVSSLATIGVGAYLFEAIRETPNREDRDTNTARLKFCNDLFQLLKAYYSAKPDRSSLQTNITTTLDQHKLATLFSDFAYVNTIPRIVARVDKVLFKRNFGRIFQGSIETMAQSVLQDWQVAKKGKSLDNNPQLEATSLETAKAHVRSRPFLRGGSESPTASLEEKFRSNQSVAQARVLQRVYDRVASWVDDGVKMPCGVTKWQESNLNARGFEEFIFFSEQGRLHFHQLHSAIMAAISHYSAKLKAAGKEVEIQARTKNGDDSAKSTLCGKLLDCSRALNEAFVCLTYLRSHFREVLESYYMWLQDVWKPSSTTDAHQGYLAMERDPKDKQNLRRSRRAILSESGSGSMPLTEYVSGLSQRSESSMGPGSSKGPQPPKAPQAFNTPKATQSFKIPETNEVAPKGRPATSTPQLSSARSTPLTQPKTPEPRGTPGSLRAPDSMDMSSLKSSLKSEVASRGGKESDVFTSAPDDVIDGDPETDEDCKEIDIIGKKEWHSAASEFVGLLCRQQDSIDALLDAEIELSERFKRASLQPVIAAANAVDQQMMPTSEFLRLHKPEGKEYPEEKLKDIANFIDKHDRINKKYGEQRNENFSGTYHAETLLLSLKLLARKRDEMVDAAADTTNAAGVLALPNEEVTDALEQLGVALAVNKRCCPVCFLVLSRAQEVTGIQFLCPGKHSDWFSTVLPPFLPKEDFDAIFQGVLGVFWDVIETAMVEEERMARSEDSGGTRSAPTRSTPSGPKGGDAGNAGAHVTLRLDTISAARRDSSAYTSDWVTTNRETEGKLAPRLDQSPADFLPPSRPHSVMGTPAQGYSVSTPSSSARRPGGPKPHSRPHSMMGTPAQGFDVSNPHSGAKLSGDPKSNAPGPPLANNPWQQRPANTLFHTPTPAQGSRTFGSNIQAGGVRSRPIPQSTVTTSELMPPPPPPQTPQHSQKRQASSELQRDDAGVRNLGWRGAASVTTAAVPTAPAAQPIGRPAAQPAAQPTAPSIASSNPFAALTNTNSGQNESSQDQSASARVGARGSRRRRPNRRPGGQDGGQ